MTPNTDSTTHSGGVRAPTDGGETLSLDACLELLANRQRRVILDFFMSSEEECAPIGEIVSAIISDEARATGERPGYDSVKTALFHIHLPKFADAGVLEYDTRHLEIRYQGNSRIEEAYEKIQELR